MRILMSGGVKTQNIVNAIEKQFRASGDEFIIVEYLEDINGIFAKGDYFDKAIIAEQSISRDGTFSDEYEIRQRINDFALECANRPRKVSYVFFTPNEHMAEMIYDEILPIIQSSVVVLQAPPYFATFFKTIVVNDIGQLPSSIVYVPQNLTADTVDTGEDISNDPFFEDEPLDDVLIPDAPQDIEGDIFGDSPDFIPTEPIGDIGNDVGESMPVDEDEMPIDDDIFGEGEDFTPAQEEFDTSIYENTEFDGDDSIINTEEPFMDNRSGDIPDYTDTQQDSGYIPGFDQDEDDTMGDDLYGNPEPVQDTWVDDESMYGGGASQTPNTQDFGVQQDIDNQQGFDPLGQGLYDMPAEPVNEEPVVDNGGMYGQGQDMYGQDQNMYGYPQDQGYVPGFGPEGYDVEQTSTSNNARQPVGKKHRGIASLLGGRQQEAPNMTMGAQSIGSKDIRKVANALKPFAARGNSIVVTGCSGCGTSTIAFHLANIISQIGYTVLLVDMDTEGRTQGYISKACYDSMDTDGSNLMSAVNSSTNTNSNAVVVKQGFHLLTMGLGTDIQPIEEQLHKEKIARFVSVVKTGYNFVIYDVPFKHAINFLSDITFMCDNLVLVADASNWGITKTMLSVCNIESDDMQDTIFHRAQLVFNRYRNLSKLFGLRVKTCDDIVNAMDRKVLDLVGDDIGLQFSRMSIAGIVNDDPMFENGWYEDVQYSDTKKGQDIFIDLIESIVLKKH